MINKKRNLRTGQPVWSSYKTPRIPTKPLKHDHKADVVIIGTGISGAMIAQELSEAGFSVIMLDHRKPMSGSTMASTALLQYELDEPIIKLKKKIGTRNAVRAWQCSKLGLESLTAKIQSLNIKCDFERCDTLYLAGDVLNPAELKQECIARNAAGIQTDYLTNSKIKQEYGIARKAALRSHGSASVNPLQLTAGFLKAAIKNKTTIFCPVTVTDVIIKKNNVRVSTTQRHHIAADYVVFATGYEIPRYIKSTSHSIKSTWAIATKRQKKKIFPKSTMLWEASDPYLYIKTTPDHRIICGGEDEDFQDAAARDRLIDKKTHTLEKKLKKIFPDFDTHAQYAWAGSFGTSSTGLPSIGRIPRMRSCFAVMAYGGNGITFSRIAAEIIRDEIIGQSHPNSDLFAFQ